jgi:uroporphyrin-III C-methyltransferase/precorrin-2 dehydrogenase/sirohydrochlorin ferrochelatase
MSDLLPLFVNLTGRRVLVVGAGPVAAGKLKQLAAAGADVRVVAPAVHPDVASAGVPVAVRPFEPADLDGVWLVVAAATPEVNRAVNEAAQARQLLVNAVDDPANATAFLSGVVRRGGVTLAISTSGDAPGLTSLLREALDSILPADLGRWVAEARAQRAIWRRRAVPMGERKPLLLRALNRLYSRSERRRGGDSRGHVSIVGAGPGDPALLTRAAVQRLRDADLVLYDALVDERVLAIADRAQRFYVGKRAGRHTLSQTDIHAIMVAAGRRGRRVVRLKGGDPFVFGRGGEEALALAAAGIPYDIVPGVSSATAAPAFAGIPVTHRGVASAVLIVSGHDGDAFEAAIRGLDRAHVTVVVLMGVARRQDLAARFIAHGWSASTPAAIVADASKPDQFVWRGTLAALADGAAAVPTDAPAAIVVGAVAALDLRSGDLRSSLDAGAVAGALEAADGPSGREGIRTSASGGAPPRG